MVWKCHRFYEAIQKLNLSKAAILVAAKIVKMPSCGWSKLTFCQLRDAQAWFSPENLTELSSRIVRPAIRRSAAPPTRTEKPAKKFLVGWVEPSTLARWFAGSKPVSWHLNNRQLKSLKTKQLGYLDSFLILPHFWIEAFLCRKRNFPKRLLS